MSTKPSADLIATGIGQLYTSCPADSPAGGDPGLERSTFIPELIPDAALASAEGELLYVGPEDGLDKAVEYSDAIVVDASGGLVTPGLIDCHTHLVFAGSRQDEYALRSVGVGYQEIAAAGGGIRASVRRFRESDSVEVIEQAAVRLQAMALTGTTTVEIKSGYGLSLASELKALTIIDELDGEVPLRVVPTFMGAHEVPDEYQDDREAYIDLIINEMLPIVEEQAIARYCDVFCETGVFSAAEAERILKAGQQHGLQARIHSDEFDAIGGTEMAARIGALSADHLAAVTPAGIAALAASQTVGVLLPGTTVFLGKEKHAPARDLLDAGVTVAIATDFNPGSSTFLSLPLMTTFACSLLGMHPAEALQAVTANAARALGFSDQIGQLKVGMAADFVLWDADDYRMIPYAAGHPLAIFGVVAGEVIPFD
ncbi:imidazolonepropionase [Gemmatimonadota bacterium]